jgi:hypothetical protein
LKISWWVGAIRSELIGETKRQRLFGKGLVASQVALSLVLVSLAGLFVGYLSKPTKKS